MKRATHQLERAYEAAFEALAFGIVVCSDDGDIVFANTAAAAFVRSAPHVANRGDKISAATPAETRRLLQLIASAAKQGKSGVMLLRDEGNGHGIVAAVTPLFLHFCRQRHSELALIALRAPSAASVHTAETLSALFGLSPTQAAIALAIFNGRSADQIAAERGTKITTLRSHLQKIFQRTGTETQRDLVRLLAMLPPLR